MCGISGLYHFKNSGSVEEASLVKMRDTLVHRGPDDAGIYISPDKKVGLANRRLKIIDLSSAAKMPMAAANGRAWITYNGEIYNFNELRNELGKRGHLFKTKSDTEVILRSYLEYGLDCVKRLNGMFAFVIWDDEKKILFAARDHLGVKPFFYALQGGTFYFGSEIKAILANPDFKKELNETGLYHYLTFGSAPAPYTLFKRVEKLEAAHCLVLEADGSMQIKEYWNPAIPNQKPLNENDYAEEIRFLLKDSIRSQMVSDVPFGCFLSGGIDSSLNATLMSAALGKPVETFSVGYEDFEEKNEFKYSRAIAKKLGAKNHEILLDESHFREFLPKYPYYTDDPVSDQVCFPLFWLSKLTRDNGIIVIQIGEGSDEIFAGYDAYVKILNLRQKWNWLGQIPQPLKPLFAKAAAALLRNAKLNFGIEYAQRLLLKQEPFWGLAIAFGERAKSELLSREFQNKIRESSYEIVEKHYQEIRKYDSEADYLKQMTYLELKHRLPEFLLARADKMTMAHSVEGRVPFLDKKLVELAFNMPSETKIRDGEPKYILKKAVQGVIPDEIIRRKKQGFSNPIGEWLKPEKKISGELTDIIFNSKLRQRSGLKSEEILNYDYVKKIIHEHQRKNIDHNFKIWTLITLSLWYDYWF